MNITNSKIKAVNMLGDNLWIILVIIAAVILGVCIANSKWMYVGLFLLPLIIYLSIKKPFIFPFGLYVFFIPFETMTGFESGSSLLSYLGFLTILVMLFTGIFEKKLRWPDKATLSWLVLILYCILTALWAIDSTLTLSIYTFQTLIGLFLLYYVVSSYAICKEDIQIIKLYVFLGGLISAIYALWNVGWLPDSRIGLAAGKNDANRFAFSLIIPFSVGIEFAMKQKRLILKSLLFVSLGILLYCINVTGSRGGFLGAAMVLITYTLFARQRMLLIVSMLVLGLILVSYTPDFIFDRWGQAAEGGGANRLYIWYIALSALQKYWPIGAGFNNFPLAFDEFAYHYTSLDKTSAASHSLFIGLFLELGIIGFILLIIALVKHYKRIKAQSAYDPESVMLKASFFGVLMHSLFLDSFKIKTSWLLWMMIMMHRNYTASAHEKQIKEFNKDV